MRVFRGFLTDAIASFITFVVIAAILGYLLDLLPHTDRAFNLELVLILAVVTGLFLPLWSRLWTTLGWNR